MSEFTVVTAENRLGKFSFLKSEEIIGPVLSSGLVWEELVNNLYTQIVDNDMVVVNIGSHIGSHTIPLAKLAKVVYAFEVQPTIYWLLLRNISINGLGNVKPSNRAVGHKDGIIVSVSNAVNDGISQGKLIEYSDKYKINYGGMALGYGNDKVLMVTLDSLNLNPRFMLIDVEGAEQMVFWGAKETIKRCMPVILYEKNNKFITKEMKEACQVQDEVRFFNFETWCHELGYQQRVIIGEERILFPIFESIPELADTYYHISGGSEFKVNVKNMKISIPDRKDADFRYLDDHRIIAFFLDYKEILTGIITDGKIINWSNGSKWVP